MRLSLLAVVSCLGLVAAACSPGPSSCSAATCPTGCCGADGRCQPGNLSTACGQAGLSCNTCFGGQTCVSGSCTSGGVGGGGAGVGGGSAAGGGSAVGGGAATGGGSAAGGGLNVQVLPPSVTMNSYDAIQLAATVNGAANQTVSWSVVSGGGSVQATGASTAWYYASSQNAGPVVVRATAAAGASTTVPITFAPVPNFYIEPEPFSNDAYPLGSKQTFTAYRYTTSSSSPNVGIEGIDWRIWPVTNTITPSGTATFPNAPGSVIIYATLPSNNTWASVDVEVAQTSSPAVEISPAVATTAPNGVVQLTATVSNGAAVTWGVPQQNSGTVNQSGTYTAPGAVGVYVVGAQVVGNPSRFAVATIVVK